MFMGPRAAAAPPASIEPGVLALEHVRNRNLIRVTGSGSWTMRQVELFNRDLDYALAAARRDYGGARLLADNREIGPQSLEVSLRMATCAEHYYGPADRLAIVIPLSLKDDTQVEVECSALTEIFLDVEVAERWLLAHDTAGRMAELTIEWGEPRDCRQRSGTGA